MKNVTIRFTVMTNSNLYFATSILTANAFCKKNDLVIDRDWDINSVSIKQQNIAEKCGRGVYCILD
jgi:hypothetical protein